MYSSLMALLVRLARHILDLDANEAYMNNILDRMVNAPYDDEV